jgi:broad specificity phosphatase PhoE
LTDARLWLLRHAEVHEDWQGKAYGGLDVPLSDRGKEHTARIAQAFAHVPLRAIHTSPLERALSLGQALAKATGAELRVEAGLAEIDRGRWQGRPIADLLREFSAEVEAFYADPWNFRMHGGENDRDVLERAWPVVEEAFAARETIALTTHYNVIRVLVAHLLGIEPKMSFRLRVDTGGAVLLERNAAGWNLVRSNVRAPRPEAAPAGA